MVIDGGDAGVGDDGADSDAGNVEVWEEYFILFSIYLFRTEIKEDILHL